MVLAILLAASEAGAKAAEVPGGMSLISSELITAIFTGMAAVLGVVWQKGRNKAILEQKDAEIKRIKAELPQPISVEQSSYQAHCKDNASDHTNLFSRMAVVEQKVAAIDAKVDANFSSLQKQLDTITNMVSQLFDRICKKK